MRRTSLGATALCALLCEPSFAQQAFEEQASERGIEYFTPPAAGAGRGLAFTDLDGDHDPDLVLLGSSDGSIGLYENDGSGSFSDRSEGASVFPGGASVVAGDYDADGDPDLFIAGWSVPSRLLNNQGGFQFLDVTAQAGIQAEGRGTGCAWGDFNGDGWLDLYVSMSTLQATDPSNLLYMNRGDGTFSDVAGFLGVDDRNKTWQAVFYDHDLDGDPDLYLSNDKGVGCLSQNYLYENVNGSFLDITAISGTEACIDSMGVAVGDFDGNQLSDLYCTNIELGNKLFLNQGNHSYIEFASQTGTQVFEVGWAALFLDIDNDGWQELYVCNMNGPNHLYRHANKWPATELAELRGLATPGASFCSASADIDGDGDIDLAVQNGNANVRLYVNNLSSPAHWARFRVVGEGHNTQAVGANLRLKAAGRQHRRQIVAGSNFKSQNELTLHYGLDGTSTIDELEVAWPSTGSVRLLEGPAPDRTWALYPSERLGDADGDGSVDALDLEVFAGCYTGPGGELLPGCEMMDFDGDWDVDHDDFSALLPRYSAALGEGFSAESGAGRASLRADYLERLNNR